MGVCNEGVLVTDWYCRKHVRTHRDGEWTPFGYLEAEMVRPSSNCLSVKINRCWTRGMENSVVSNDSISRDIVLPGFTKFCIIPRRRRTLKDQLIGDHKATTTGSAYHDEESPPFECNNPTECDHLPTAFRQRSNAVGEADSLS
jgi:hypothetical protein